MSYNWTGLTCGFKGKFYVRSYDDAGESGSSNTIDGVTTPCQPTNFSGRGQGNDITFNWAVASNHNEAGFHIYQQGVSSPVASRGPNLGSGGTNYDMTGLHCDIVATYYVTAFNSAGESPSSNLIQTETVPCWSDPVLQLPISPKIQLIIHGPTIHPSKLASMSIEMMPCT